MDCRVLFVAMPAVMVHTPVRRLLATLLVLAAVCATTPSGHAHSEYEAFSKSQGGGSVVRGPRDWDELVQAWEFEPWVVIPLALSAYWYAVGSYRIWRGAGIGHGIRRWEAASYWAGWLALVVALVSPLHPWGSMLFSAHMTQHEILMLIAASASAGKAVGWNIERHAQ
jgi:hypothetical protein